MAGNKNIKINLDYSEFSGGITECKSKMELLNSQFKLQQSQLGNNANAVDKLTLRESTLTQKIQLQETIVEQSREKLASLAASHEATTRQVDNAQKAYIRQSTSLQELKNELEQVQSELVAFDNAEGDAADSANDAADGMGSFGTSLLTAVSTITAATSAVSALASEIYGLGTATSQFADDVLTMSQTTGIATETLQEWSYASDFIDVSVETMTGSMTKMIRTMESASNGSKTAQDAFRQLGVSIDDGHGHLRDAESVFYEIIDSLGQMSNETERDATAMAIFGRSARELNPLLNAGSIALKEYGAEARALGLVIGDDTLAEWGAAQDAIDRFNQVIEVSKLQLGAQLLPVIVSVVEAISALPTPVLASFAAIGSLLKVGQSLIPVLQLLTTTTLAKTVATKAETVAETEKAGADLVAAGTATVLNAALLPQIAILLLLAAAVTAIVYLFYQLIEAFSGASEEADKTASSFNDLLSVSQSLSGISGALPQATTSYYATGSAPHAAGGLTWVGEQGAELVELPGGSTVYNHQESKSMASNSTNNYYVTIDAKNVNDFNKVVKVFNGLGQSMNRGSIING